MWVNSLGMNLRRFILVSFLSLTFVNKWFAFTIVTAKFTLILRDKVHFIAKVFISWYDEHFRAF